MITLEEAKRFFPGTVTINGLVLPMHKTGVHEAHGMIYACYCKHDGSRWRSAQFYVPIDNVDFPWPEDVWQKHVEQAARYDRQGHSGISRPASLWLE